jgi:hypothetical protein
MKIQMDQGVEPKRTRHALFTCPLGPITMRFMLGILLVILPEPLIRYHNTSNTSGRSLVGYRWWCKGLAFSTTSTAALANPLHLWLGVSSHSPRFASSSSPSPNPPIPLPLPALVVWPVTWTDASPPKPATPTLSPPCSYTPSLRPRFPSSSATSTFSLHQISFPMQPDHRTAISGLDLNTINLRAVTVAPSGSVLKPSSPPSGAPDLFCVLQHPPLLLTYLPNVVCVRDRDTFTLS